MDADIIDVDDLDLEVCKQIIHIDLTPTHIVLDGADKCPEGRQPALKVERHTCVLVRNYHKCYANYDI